MKKFIYPIAAIFALITVASFSSGDCRAKCTGKETLRSQVDQTGNLHAQRKMHSISIEKGQVGQDIVVMASEQVVSALAGFDMFDSLFLESDIQIDVQFSREETTIEVPDLVNADEMVGFQFNAENGAAVAYQAKAAAY
jgi:hypothetical protein